MLLCAEREINKVKDKLRCLLSSPTHIDERHLGMILAANENQQIACAIEQLQRHAHMSIGEGVERQMCLQREKRNAFNIYTYLII